MRAEHRDPVPQASFSIREQGWAVEKSDESNFEAVLFKKCRVLADAGVIPRIDFALGSGLQLTERLIECALHLLNIALAAELRYKPTSRTQRLPHTLYDHLRFANPVQSGIGKYGI